MNVVSLNLPDETFTLRTARLALKPVTKSDAAQLYALMKDPGLGRYMSWQPHQSIDETEQFVARAVSRFEKREAFYWCIWKDKKICGLFSLIDIKRAHYALTYNSAELSYWCAPATQDQGLTTEAAKAVIAFAFASGFHKLRVEHRADNDASKRVIAKLGFHFIGVQRDHYYKDGKWHNQHAYDLLATDQGAV